AASAVAVIQNLPPVKPARVCFSSGFFFSSRRRHTRFKCDWSSDVCSSDLSPFRGFSVEFVQHREYVPGDDIRHIDWKGYGRSERYTIKQYEQETDFIGHLLLDASRSMLYGDGPANKLEYAKLLAAVLAYAIIHQRDSASLAVFDNAWRTQLPVSSQPGHVLTILQALESTSPADKTSIGPLLHDLAQQARRRG